MLIARACPIMCVFHKHGGQRAYKGHVVNLPQNIQGFLDTLPANVNDLPILIVRRQGSHDTYADFRVRRERVLSALLWLKQNNKCYSDIHISQDALQRLPENDVPPDLCIIQAGNDDIPDQPQTHPNDSNHINSPHQYYSHSLLPSPAQQRTEDTAIRSMINGENPLDWPVIEGNAMNEFQTPFLATMAFPTLFSYASGDPTNPARHHSVSLTDGFKHLIKFGETDNDMHWRFANHPRFPYWALNMKQRHQLLSQSTIYLKQHPNDANLTVDDLRSMVGSMPAAQLIQRLQRYAAKVQGSSTYWFQRYLELRALLDDKGPPTFFWTVSSADNYWPEMHNLMMHDTSQPSRSVRVQAVINNPHMADWFFTAKLSEFVDHWLYKTLDAQWHWYRFEYQARGSTHAHGCAKLKNDPGICSLVQKAAAAWSVKLQLQEGNASPNSEEEAILECGKEATKLVTDYADWLITTCNPCPPDELWSVPDPHPCSLPFNQVEDVDTDYSNLVNCVQRHTQCSAAYCLRKRPNSEEAQCHFNYPIPEQSTTELAFEKLPCGSIRATLTTKRNDQRVNSHNRVQLQHWRANVDLQLIVDVDACARYMAKYAAKGEPKSQTVHSLYKSCVDSLTPSSHAHKALRSAMLKCIGERDYSAQETCHMLLSLPLYSCSFNFATVNLDGSKKISTDSDSGDLLVETSIIDAYASRDSSLCSQNLYEFLTQYYLVKGKLCKRNIPVIVRTFPTYSSNPQGDKYAQYCRIQLLKYQVWSNTTNHIWQSDPSNDNLTACYHDFLQTPYAQQCVPHFAKELDQAQQYVLQDPDDNEETETEHHQEDWMQLCSLNTQYATTINSAHSYNWNEYAQSLPPQKVREAATWITSTRKNTSDSAFTRHIHPVDVTTLNSEQALAYKIVQSHSEQLASIPSPPPLHMVVCGTAGTGKSYLISALSQLLGDKCVLTGTTGMAAYSIGGRTLHSTLQIPIHPTAQKDLTGNSLQRLQMRFQGKHYIIIDEMSMLGQKTFSWVDKRLRQATGALNEPLGGISLLLFGDFAQLPPVADTPLFSHTCMSGSAFEGFTVYQTFSTVVILKQILRQAGTDAHVQAFKDLLMRIREGAPTHSDWKCLLDRTPINSADTSRFEDAVRLFYDKHSVAKFNYEKLHTLQTPTATINALHSSSAAASAKPDDAGGLHPVLFLATGAKVMLTANLWQEAGLCNGTHGTVESFIYQQDITPPSLPIAVLVHFPNYCGPQFLQSNPNCIPIPPITFEWDSKSRQQLPLQLRYAITIHKSQGQTLPKAVIDLGKSEVTSGLTFVALSRLRRLEDGLFQPMTYDRLKNIRKSKRFEQRLNKEKRLAALFKETKSSFANLF